MSGKKITAAVGLGEINIPADVATIQYLLNCVPVSYGGPMPELTIDGFVGVKTIQAINRFQTVQFGRADGRIEPEQFGGMAFGTLKTYDPFPFSPPVVPLNYKPDVPAFYDGQVLGKKHSGVRGKKHSGGPGRPATAAELSREPMTSLPRGKALGKKITR